MRAKEKTREQQRPTKQVLVVLILTLAYMIAEIVGGFISNSLALLADAGHMFADVAALAVSLFAFVITSRPPNSKATFGYYRAEILAALFNGVLLLLVSFFIVKEAAMRLFTSEPVHAQSMIVVAVGGLLVNVIGLLVLHRGKSSNLNLKGAWLHVLSDTLGSVGVIISGILIALFDWTIADPIASMVIALLVSYSSIKLILQTLNVLMERTPNHIDYQKVYEAILSVKHVEHVHDLHIWSITSGKEALSAHVEIEKVGLNDQILAEIQKKLADDFDIDHLTIQLEIKCQAGERVC